MSTFTLLGTGSCEGIPAPFCTCKLCNHARVAGAKERRRRFSLLVDEALQIDFGPDTADSWRTFNIDETKIRHICITHSHADHFQPLDLMWRNALTGAPALDLAGNAEVLKMYDATFQKEFGHKPEKAINKPMFHDVVPGKTLILGGYKILAVRASHMKFENDAVNYLVTTPQGRKLLILADTGWWCQESFDLVKGEMADAVVVELSCGTHPGEDIKKEHHLGAQAAMEFINELKTQNSVKPDAICVTTHVSHVPQTTQKELEEYFKDTFITAGYDGLKVEF